jgi:hypothetical protein
MSNEVKEIVAEVSSMVTPEHIQVQINKLLSENGTNKVITSTGYTFDEEGLNINKSGSDITTTITEDGMTIYRKDHKVLVTDNLGVKAEDLHATTFLIVGDNSRFENFKNDRTGCFYIGKVSV